MTIYDLSEGGCFVNCLTAPPEPGRNLVLKIDLPEEGWICLKSEVKYAKPEFGFAVSFVDVPSDAANRLRHGILQGLAVRRRHDPFTPWAAPGAAVTLKRRSTTPHPSSNPRAPNRSSWQTMTGKVAGRALGQTPRCRKPSGRVELIRRLRERQPSLKVLIMTGHEAMLNEHGYDWWAKERHLGKPFTVGDLRHAVTELIGSP